MRLVEFRVFYLHILPSILALFTIPTFIVCGGNLFQPAITHPNLSDFATILTGLFVAIIGHNLLGLLDFFLLKKYAVSNLRRLIAALAASAPYLVPLVLVLFLYPKDAFDQVGLLLLAWSVSFLIPVLAGNFTKTNFFR